MNRKIIYKFILVAMLILQGCVLPKTSYVGGTSATAETVKTIALAPSGGVLADAIGLELSKYGFNVADTQKTQELMAKLSLYEASVMQPANLLKLKENGIDAYLSVKTIEAYSGLPKSAGVRLNSTYDGKVLTAVAWQNGWVSMGAAADRIMIKDVSWAASDIAKALTKKIKPQK